MNELFFIKDFKIQEKSPYMTFYIRITSYFISELHKKHAPCIKVNNLTLHQKVEIQFRNPLGLSLYFIL